MSDTTTTRVAVVTGASGGIGRAVAERLAADGMAVGVHYASNKVAADETVGVIDAAGGRAIAVTGDVADEIVMAGAFDAVEAAFGGIDVVVHTAGVMILGTVAEFDLADLDRLHRRLRVGSSGGWFDALSEHGAVVPRPLSSQPGEDSAGRSRVGVADLGDDARDGPVCGLKRVFRRVARGLSVQSGEMAKARRPHSLPPSTYSGLGGLRQDPGCAAESPAVARTCGNGE